MTAWSSYAEQSSLKVLTAAETTVIYSLEPLFAAVFSSIFLHEYFGFNSFVGALCIVTACLWNTVLLPTLSPCIAWPICLASSQVKSPLGLEHKSIV
jgi:threonine/homoserine efflux transporter RhtA